MTSLVLAVHDSQKDKTVLQVLLKLLRTERFKLWYLGGSAVDVSRIVHKRLDRCFCWLYERGRGGLKPRGPEVGGNGPLRFRSRLSCRDGREGRVVFLWFVVLGPLSSILGPPSSGSAYLARLRRGRVSDDRRGLDPSQPPGG